MKKNIIVISIFIVIIALLVIFFPKGNDYSNNKIIEINYSYGGGFGTMVDTAEKTITITNDGTVVLSNDYNSYTESFNLSKSKYMELSNYIHDRISLFNEKAQEDVNVLDGGFSSIKIKLDNGETKKIGGYMIKNKKFNEIEVKISKIIDSDKLHQYHKNIELNQSN